MIPLKNKKETKDFVDDGRVIADMNVDGVPHSVFRRTSFNIKKKKKKKEESVGLSKKERRSIFLGVFTSYILVGLITFGAFALLIYFSINVWFK